MSLLPQLEDYLVFIGDGNRNSFAGAGFIVKVSQNYFIVTATHVVALALGIARDKLTNSQNENIDVFFPKARRWIAHVSLKAISSYNADDIAILNLPIQPEGTIPAVVGTVENSQNFKFLTAGSRLAGTRANGSVIGVEIIPRNEKKHPRFELLSSQIDRGMSGGPIVHSESKLVVGMVVSTWYSTNNKDQATAYAATSTAIASYIDGLLVLQIENGEYKLDELAYKVIKSYESNDPGRLSLFGLQGEFFVDMPLWEYGYEYVDETTVQFDWLSEKEKEAERNKGMIAESVIDYLLAWTKTSDTSYLALLSEFGMGKSTVLYRLEYLLSQEFLLYHKMCPIRISLGQKYQSGKADLSLLTKIIEFIKNEYNVEFNDSELNLLLNSGRLVLLLDSFDEMSLEVKPGVQVVNLDMILQDVDFADVKVIIASRDNYFFSNQDIKEIFQDLDPFFKRINFNIVYLRGFRPKEIKQYLQYYLRDKADKLLSEINTIPDLADLARRPILLVMMTILEGGIVTQKITSRKELYDEFVRVWIKRERFNGRLKLDEAKIKSVLSTLADYTSRIPGTSFSQDKLNRLLMKKYNFSLIDAVNFGTDFKVCCFLGRDTDDNYKFLHNSFREYFYASFLFEQLKKGNLEVLRPTFISIGVANFLLEDLKKIQGFSFQLQSEIKTTNGEDYLLTNAMMLYELILKDELKTSEFYISMSNDKIKPDSLLTTQENLSGNFVVIPSGNFLMGSWKGRVDETPVHMLEINSFALGRYVVTNLEFDEFVRNTNYITVAERIGSSRMWTGGKWKYQEGVDWKNPRYDKVNIHERWNHPVVQIAWEDAVTFCEWKSKRVNRIVELPTESEWEYACKSGSQSNWCFGDDELVLQDYAWYKKNLDQNIYTQPVGLKKPNSWGLYDMHGNVREWCNTVYDRYPGNNLGWDLGSRYYSTSFKVYHVLRGGHFGSNAHFLRSAVRVSGEEGMSSDYTGFRLKIRLVKSKYR